MPLENLLQLNIAALVAMGSLLLGMGQNNHLLPMFAVGSAVVSVFLTDFWRIIRLNTIVANIAGILAVVFCLSDFFEFEHKQEQLFAVANLLVYLQIVLLFQKKNNRLYGHLLVLSLLQVVVASALGLALQFGIMLVIYMFAALTAMCLFFFHRELARHAAEEIPNPSSAATSQENIQGSESTADPFRMLANLSYVELVRDLTLGGLVRCVVTMGCATMIISCALFFTIPRAGTSEWQSERTSEQEIGFTPKVTFNETGMLRRSGQKVMRVTFVDPHSEEPYPIIGEPYFRGTVLWDYSTTDGAGQWRQVDLNIADEYVQLNAVPVDQFLIRQEIVLEPRRDQILFSVYPIYQNERTPNGVIYNVRERQLVHRLDDNYRQRGEFRYSLSTTTFASGWQDSMIGHCQYTSEIENAQEIRQLLEIDLAQFPRLKEIADSVASDARATDRLSLARALESHLRNSGDYQYETDFDRVQALRQPGVDPIEDFVANHRSGHCEYFASTLALMLRTQGIPSRLVVGYLGGEYNSFGKYFIVREEHAHAWVEAYLEPDQIPPSHRHHEWTSSGAWLRLDPTPPGHGGLPISSRNSIVARMSQWVDYTQLLWSEYVVGLNSERQYKSIYRPLLERITNFLRVVFGRETWGTLLQQIMELKWFNWRAGLVTATVLLLVAGVHRLLREPLQQVWQKFRQSRTPAPIRGKPSVEFYDRLESLLAQHGWQRLPGQTQYEFAQEVGGQLADQPHRQKVASMPRRVVEAFYRIRFGGDKLNYQELQTVEQAMTALQSTLSTTPVLDRTQEP
ncbi:MAG: DUF3488 and transglutaminase-like domain-containing protein [Pirellulaceae bacterium]|nr:DUF3488 and transglutaminase-like domain-containing protein [Pirellulaceae bacterium]